MILVSITSILVMILYLFYKEEQSYIQQVMIHNFANTDNIVNGIDNGKDKDLALVVAGLEKKLNIYAKKPILSSVNHFLKRRLLLIYKVQRFFMNF